MSMYVGVRLDGVEVGTSQRNYKAALAKTKSPVHQGDVPEDGSSSLGRIGCPLEVHSDQGRNIERKLFKEMCVLLQITKTRTTPYRPSASGQVERFNRSNLHIMWCSIQGRQDDWVHLGTVGMAIRSTVNRQTGFTLNFLMLG